MKEGAGADLVGKTLITSHDWTVTGIDADGTVTLQSHMGFTRVLTAGKVSVPDPASARIAEIQVPIQLLRDAIEHGLLDAAEPVPPDEPTNPRDTGPRQDSDPKTFAALVCADWSSNPGGRAAYVARPADRVIRRVDFASCTFETLISESVRMAKGGPVLIGIDVPIGIPKSFASHPGDDLDFTQWLRTTVAHSSDFLRPCGRAEEWLRERPFFAVQSGKGGYTRWVDLMRAERCEPLRDVDRLTGAKSLFVTSGSPGSVGSSVLDIWPQLLQHRRTVSVWPFDGPLKELMDPRRPTVAEIYPRALYGIALSPHLEVARRPRLKIFKREPACRVAALNALREQKWVRTFGVEIHDGDRAIANDDAFDALMSVAALLRCVLEETPLDSAYRSAFEGGMLASLSLNIHLPEAVFPCGGREVPRSAARYADKAAPRSSTDVGRILACLNRLKTRATYGSVAGAHRLQSSVGRPTSRRKAAGGIVGRERKQWTPIGIHPGPDAPGARSVPEDHSNGERTPIRDRRRGLVRFL